MIKIFVSEYLCRYFEYFPKTVADVWATIEWWPSLYVVWCRCRLGYFLGFHLIPKIMWIINPEETFSYRGVGAWLLRPRETSFDRKMVASPPTEAMAPRIFAGAGFFFFFSFFTQFFARFHCHFKCMTSWAWTK